MSLHLELEPHPLGDAAVPDEVEEDRRGYELIDGEWVEKGMSNLSAIVESNFHEPVKAHVRVHKLGNVFSPGGRYRMLPDRPNLIRKPDLSFVRAGRFPGNAVPPQVMNLAPDLAVEVVSPTDVADDVAVKLDEYIRAGVRLTWVAYLPARVVWAYKPDGTARRYAAGDVLDGSDVLPGFTLPVADVFEGV